MQKKLQVNPPQPALKTKVAGWATACGLAATLALAPQLAVAQARNVQAELDALIKSAKAEGEVTFYIGLTENVATRIAGAFTAKYGIKAQFIRLDAVALIGRYSAEAEAGNIAADVFSSAGGADAFSEEALKKGWIEPLTQAGIPMLNSGEFPAALNRGRSAIMSVSPWMLVYNTDKVKGADLPKDWIDLLNPKWKGQVIVNNPAVSGAFIDFWSVIQDKYGDQFLTKLKDNIRPVGTPLQGTQGVGAGEASFMLPVVQGQVQGAKDKGAPLNTILMSYTTGVVTHVMLTTKAKARHYNAGRLFINYVLSPEGNKVVNDDPGGFTIYDTSRLPKDYTSPKPGSAGRKDAIVKMLGF